MMANSLEAAANALLISLDLGKDSYKDIERLGTLSKFKVFCLSLGKRLDHGDIKLSRIKDIVNYRNQFVHPKPGRAKYIIDSKTSNIEFKVTRTKARNYPLYFNEVTFQDCANALDDSLSFLSWVCFDVCALSIENGANRLGVKSYGSTADIDIISAELGRKFDQRTFGKSR